MGAGVILSQRIVSLAPPPATPDIAFNDFSNGLVSPAGKGWFTDGGGNTTGDVIADPTGSGRGYVFRWRAPGGSDDANRGLSPPGGVPMPAHFFWAADLYYPANTPHYTDSSINRKINYFRNATEYGDPRTGYIVLHQWGSSLTAEWVTDATAIARDGIATISAGQWHRIEMEIQLNTAANLSDGLFRVWVDGTLAHQELNWKTWSTAGASPFRYNFVAVGYQVENASTWSEERYWDNIGFATFRIG